MKFKVELEGFPTEVFGPDQQQMIVGHDGIPMTDMRPWDAERAWDCYKRKHPKTRRRYHGGVPTITPVQELEAVGMDKEGTIKPLSEIKEA